MNLSLAPVAQPSADMPRSGDDALIVLLPALPKAQADASNAPDGLLRPTSSKAVLGRGQPFAQRPELAALVDAAHTAGDFSGRTAQVLALYQHPAAGVRHLIVLGAGEGTAASAAADVRRAIVAARAHLRAPSIKSATVAVALADAAPAADASRVIAAIVHALHDALYTYTHTKAPSEKSPPPALADVHIALNWPGASDADWAALQQAFARARAAAAGQTLAREWGNRPPNHATPTHLAEAAQDIAARHARMQCTVHGPTEVAALNMGAFQAVAQGSCQPLRFIELHYRGAADADAAPIVLVGKGITFDSGGISIKPAAAMDEMKFDMCGAASVLGVFEALGRLQPAINVTGLIAACENLPDGQALKPGDVITSMSGQTIEVLNTDAEGRLILCDALTFAKRFKPRAIVDIATLTGACVIALGGVRSGLFASDDALAAQLTQAGDAASDLCWRMPLDADYAQGLQSNFADVANVAGRQAGSVTAAKFLQRFVDKDTPWAHLDIAGTAWLEGKAKGATGRPVPLLVQFLTADV